VNSLPFSRPSFPLLRYHGEFHENPPRVGLHESRSISSNEIPARAGECDDIMQSAGRLKWRNARGKGWRGEGWPRVFTARERRDAAYAREAETRASLASIGRLRMLAKPSARELRETARSAGRVARAPFVAACICERFHAAFHKRGKSRSAFSRMARGDLFLTLLGGRPSRGFRATKRRNVLGRISRFAICKRALKLVLLVSVYFSITLLDPLS